MHWPWNRTEPPRATNHTDRLPDGDRALRPGEPRWADLLRTEREFGEATQPLPLLAPLLTAGQVWRTRRSWS